MGKSKPLTPQEIYRARKQREEAEQMALLPPGLYNHGNTGLLATTLLSDLAQFKPISPMRSPQLTNAHPAAGSYKQNWVNAMPIGDAFLSHRRRESLSPRQILGTLGRKYDQYLDFAQQDAHEFLRILLDATRMEEQDVIKKRQPPPDTRKIRRRSANGNLYKAQLKSEGNSAPMGSIPEEEKLMSLADMVFGGKLSSILVCQKCKHVSETFEDFNDISLSIKAEDYRIRKRDRLKKIAKRLTTFPSSGLANESGAHRSSSVPPTPREREDGQLTAPDEPPIDDDPRRRSFDVVPKEDADSEQSTSKEGPETPKSDGSPVLVNGLSPLDEEHNVERKEPKDDDGWTKIGRRISMSVGLGKVKERKSRPRKRSQELPDGTGLNDVQIAPSANTSLPAAPAPQIRLSRPSSPSQNVDPPQSPPPASPPEPTRNPSPTRFPSIQRSRSPKPPKPSAAEMEFLRQILADVAIPTTNPFTLLKPPNTSTRSFSTGSVSLASPGAWLNMSQFSGIEECLRMFTAVEILDGDNMVGCRRCWKIANGVYRSDSIDQEEEESDPTSSPVQERLEITGQRPPGPSPRKSPATRIPASMSTPTISFYSHPNPSESESVSSLPLNLDVTTNGAPPGTSATTPGSMPTISTIPSSPQYPSDLSPFSLLTERFPLFPPALSYQDDHHSPPPPLPHALARWPPISRLQTICSLPDTGASVTSQMSESSAGTSMHSESSVSANPTRRPDLKSAPAKKKSRPKPTIMRPAYKRYLIATPPPVLVIHLKRFQQISKTYMMSFSHGFKKLDDYVTFPEYLDLTPFLAPKKEDYGLGRKKRKPPKPPLKDNERCMYRLYAVVVHIGNMLGGHYIAYTALPNTASDDESTTAASTTSSETKTETHPPRQWAYISDTIVRLTTLEEVLRAKAYICMFERI
ncbi:hypothetical protein BD779DRAFT_1611709 [Infundibulicybe gibba]|nr:hypothetical protein BD779DRAFT_1611709 [Infundibulicybe gibba]